MTFEERSKLERIRRFMRVKPIERSFMNLVFLSKGCIYFLRDIQIQQAQFATDPSYIVNVSVKKDSYTTVDIPRTQSQLLSQVFTLQEAKRLHPEYFI